MKMTWITRVCNESELAKVLDGMTADGYVALHIIAMPHSMEGARFMVAVATRLPTNS